MARFVLKNNCFESDSMVKQQVSGAATGTKFVSPYACILTDRVETEFLEKEHLKPWIWLKYVDDTLFVWTHGHRLLNRGQIDSTLTLDCKSDCCS